MSQSPTPPVASSTTASPALNQLQTGIVPAKPSAGGSPTSALSGAAFSGVPTIPLGPSTFNTLGTPEATGGAGGSGSATGASSGTVSDAQQPGAGKTTQSGSNDAVSNDVSATLTAVGGSTDAKAGSSSTTAPNGTASTQPITGPALDNANDAPGHLNAYLSVYA